MVVRSEEAIICECAIKTLVDLHDRYNERDNLECQDNVSLTSGFNPFVAALVWAGAHKFAFHKTPL